jgi:ABC-type sugar transport system permease subunit
MKFFERQEFVGLLNYINLFKEPRFIENLVHTAVFIISSVSLQFIVGYGMALLLNRPLRYRTVVRTIILVSWTISEIAVAFMWRWMLQPQFGLINPLIKMFGINQEINVFGDTDLAMITLVIASVWRGAGFTLVMILAALQAIPDSGSTSNT